MRLRDVSDVFNIMLDRVGSWCDVVGVGFTDSGTDIKDNTEYLKLMWSQVERSLQYQYSAHHILPESEHKCHCYRFALNTGHIGRHYPRDHNHNSLICKLCIKPFLLFDKTTILL